MDTKYIVNLSGGKDSTAMLLMLLEKGCPVDYILFADTGKDFPQMQEHLRKLAEYIKEHHPTAPEITILKHEKGFDYMMFEHRKCRGKYKDTPGNGWASFRNRWCTSRLKLDVIYKYCKTLACDCVHYIGIAADEPGRLKDDPHLIYPLAQWEITEKEALTYCYTRGFDWGGLYKHFDRVSCWCCPLQPLDALRVLRREYPELWKDLLEMDARACNQFKPGYTVAELDERFRREDAGELKVKQLRKAKSQTAKKIKKENNHEQRNQDLETATSPLYGSEERPCRQRADV